MHLAASFTTHSSPSVLRSTGTPFTFRAYVTAMAGLSLAHDTIEMQNSEHKAGEPIEQDQKNKPKHPPNRYF
jgi:hypothetical protein